MDILECIAQLPHFTMRLTIKKHNEGKNSTTICIV